MTRPGPSNVVGTCSSLEWDSESGSYRSDRLRSPAIRARPAGSRGHVGGRLRQHPVAALRAVSLTTAGLSRRVAAILAVACLSR
jgi:hypothetical protein